MVDVTYDQEQNIALFTARGALEMHDIVVAVKHWGDHPNYDNDINLLWDLRDCNWQKAASEFLLLPDEISAHVNAIWKGEKVAWAVTGETEVALVDTHLATVGWTATWRAFTSLEDARRWLYGDAQVANETYRSCS